MICFEFTSAQLHVLDSLDFEVHLDHWFRVKPVIILCCYFTLYVLYYRLYLYSKLKLTETKLKGFALMASV